MNIAASIIDLVYPRRCPVCDKPVKLSGSLICRKCSHKIRYIGGMRCYKCGKELREEAEYCRDCEVGNHVYDSGRALFVYRSVARSIYRYKYAGRREYSEFYGTQMAARLGKVINSWNPDAIVPVPLHERRFSKRGYNQAALLARVVGRETGVPVYEDLIVRSRRTVAQKELNAVERQNNLKRAFKITRFDVELESVIIVDDIYTTGATIDAMAAVLKAAGCEHVYFLALSIGAGV